MITKRKVQTRGKQTGKTKEREKRLEWRQEQAKTKERWKNLCSVRKEARQRRLVEQGKGRNDKWQGENMGGYNGRNDAEI